MFERFTDRARRVLVLSQEEARLLNHNFIGTGHLLLGLIREGEGVAASVLGSLEVHLGAARQTVADRMGPAETAVFGSTSFTPRAKEVLELALSESLQLGHTYIGTEHLLLGLVREVDGVAAEVMVAMGADLAVVRQRVIGLISGSGYQPARSPTGGNEAIRIRRPALSDRPVVASFEPVPDPEPSCGGCGARLVDTARYRHIDVAPSDTEAASEVLSVPVVFCSRCGAVLGASGPVGPIASGNVAWMSRSGLDAWMGRTGRGAAASPSRSRRLPDGWVDPVDLGAVAPAARVELLRRDRRRIDGAAAGAEVRLDLEIPSHRGTASGVFAGAPVAASWHVDDNATGDPAPTGTLSGRLGDQTVSLRGRFHLHPDFSFDRASIDGEVGGQGLQAVVTAAEGGFDTTGTVAADGTIGDTPFRLSASVAGDLARAVVRGSIGDRPFHLDAASDASTSTVRIVGGYEGPPALLAVMVGALLYFM